MLSKTLVIAALMGLLFAFAGTAAQAQTSTTWTKGTTYQDPTTPCVVGNGAGSHNSVTPVPLDFKLDQEYDSSLPQGGGDTTGKGLIDQKYLWNGGAGPETPLNIQLNVGAYASGSGTYQSSCSAQLVTTQSPVGGAGTSAPPASSLPPNAHTTTVYDAAAPNSTVGAYTASGNAYVVQLQITGDARIQNPGNQALAEITAVFGQPF